MPVNGTLTLLLQPRDPIIVRDARPFSADPGARAVTLGWPLPQTVAGALRTHVGNLAGFDWSRDGPDRARQISVRGPFLVARTDGEAPWTVFLPAPLDCVLYRDEAGLQALRLRPLDVMPAGCGCDLPSRALRPLGIERDVKAETPYQFWSLDDVLAWLSQPGGASPPRFPLPPLPRETRTHVGIDPTTLAHREGALFSTTALAFAERAERDGGPATAMLCRVEGAPAGRTLGEAVLPVGGERRLVAITALDGAADVWPAAVVPGGPSLPAARLSLFLASPALFGRGWLPAWLDPDTLAGAPPGLPDLRLRLVGAAAGRRLGISGWDLQRGGPKATRFAVPAGSVYFFEVAGAPTGPAQWRALWLHAVSDGGQDRRDGYGLVLPGVW